jgi:Tannase and feruloyl esterase
MRAEDFSNRAVMAGATRNTSRRCFEREVLLAAVIVAVLVASAPSFAASCESLSKLKLANTTITSAGEVRAGKLTPSANAVVPPPMRGSHFGNLPAYCRVTATVKPVADSDIKIEVWMPVSGWNGKFLGVGNGGWAGSINYGGLAQGVSHSFATASTDTGHAGTGSDARFAFGHPEKLIDLGYRAVHEMTVEGKAITAAFYGKASRLAYWDGCSTGGKQGLTEAQRYPRDYNGIVEGDPASFWTHLMFGTIWPAEFTLKNPAGYIPQNKYLLIHNAAIKACDALDGVTDGIVNDPTRCHFDPETLACKGEETATCLTAAQVESARKIYAGPKNPRTGEQIFPGLEPGSELGWGAEAGGPHPMAIPASYFEYVLFKNPDWDFRTLNFDRDVKLADQQDGPILNAINPDLQAFKAHGGKLIMYHGWSDPLIAPLESVDYYKNVAAAMGGLSATQSFARLFMVPGMMHCGGGPGPDSWDKVGVLDEWVEQGRAPDKIIASHLTRGRVDMTRPLCPYPEVARWKRSGSTNDAANFVCVNPNEEAAR